MINLYLKNFLKSNIIILIFIFIFSFFVNYYYSSLGAFPIDTFFHYDSSARILKGEFPIRDFWIVSGFIIDLLQSLFFKVFGINWFAYVFHSSIFNFLMSLIIYYYFQSLNINRLNSLFLTCCFSILAYTISGTPFVDHHAIFFLLISTILLIKVLETEKKYLWFLFILFFFLSLLTKQVPALYTMLTQGLVICAYILFEKKFLIIKYLCLNTSIIILIFILLLFYWNISLEDFYIQYIDHPRSIGSERFENFNLSLNGFFNNYKFIILPLIISMVLKLNKIIKKNYISKKEFYIFLILCSFSLSAIFHQVMTKNQIYIYFLIPVLSGVLLKDLEISNHRLKLFFSYLLLFSIFLVTTKYHLRYNENRKFHELQNINLNNSIPASNINKDLSGLLWINPVYKEGPKKEIILLKKGINILEEEENEIMLLTHYLFLDSITEKKLNYPSRSFTNDGASMPVNGMKYFNYYKKFLLNKMRKNDVKKIYFFKHEGIEQNIITDFLKLDCFSKSENEIFYILNIKKCI